MIEDDSFARFGWSKGASGDAVKATGWSQRFSVGDLAVALSNQETALL